MTATIADLPRERLSELAGHLKKFSPGHKDDELESLQYWEILAEVLRSDQPNKFSSYTNAVSLVTWP